MKLKSLRTLPLRLQFAFAMVALIVVLVAIVGRLVGQQEQLRLRSVATARQQHVVLTLGSTVADAVVAEDSALLRQVLGRIGRSDPQILLLEARDEQGKLLMKWQRDTERVSVPTTLYTFPVRLEAHVVGHVRLLHDLTAINAAVEERVKSLQYLVAAALCLVALLVTLLVHILAIRPLRRIDAQVSALRRGEDPEPLEGMGASEFGNVAYALNALARSAKERAEADRSHREDLATLNDAYRRFVPAEFLANLHHDSIHEVHRGDQVARDMTVLFADVRSFTNMSQQIGAQATFDFINDLLSRLGPSVREHNGFIDKYIGDAIMALFDSPTDALQAAVSMVLKLRQLNREREADGLQEVRIGIGINTGPLMLGVIGEDERMEGTVVGDAVNLAARLEGLTKKYHVPVLFSEDTLNAHRAELAEGREQREGDVFAFRYVEAVKAKGRKTLTPVYELYEGDEDSVRKRKAALAAWRKVQEPLPQSRRIPPPSAFRRDPLWAVYAKGMGFRVPVERRTSAHPILEVEEELRWS